MSVIKICGLRRTEDVAIVNRYRPDYAGFIMAPPFWRYVSPETVRELKQKMDPSIQAVGVFVDQEAEQIAALLNAGIIDIAQLHGQEDETYIAHLRTLTDKPLIKAFKIRSEEDVRSAERSSADYLLLDGGTGTGQTFDWHLLETVKRSYFLAGGLSPDNIAEALRQVAPWGVDVSSGVESDKVKDPEKIRRFVEECRK